MGHPASESPAQPLELPPSPPEDSGVPGLLRIGDFHPGAHLGQELIFPLSCGNSPGRLRKSWTAGAPSWLCTHGHACTCRHGSPHTCAQITAPDCVQGFPRWVMETLGPPCLGPCWAGHWGGGLPSCLVSFSAVWGAWRFPLTELAASLAGTLGPRCTNLKGFSVLGMLEAPSSTGWWGWGWTTPGADLAPLGIQPEPGQGAGHCAATCLRPPGLEWQFPSSSRQLLPHARGGCSRAGCCRGVTRQTATGQGLGSLHGWGGGSISSTWQPGWGQRSHGVQQLGWLLLAPAMLAHSHMVAWSWRAGEGGGAPNRAILSGPGISHAPTNLGPGLGWGLHGGVRGHWSPRAGAALTWLCLSGAVQ